MILTGAEQLASSLEQGLGESSWLIERMPSTLRLRDSVCGVTSVAVAAYFQNQGHSVELRLSKPHLSIDPRMQHVVAAVETDNGVQVIDPTYSQFLEYVGLVPGYVEFGGEDLYPETKIFMYPDGQHDDIAAYIALASEEFLSNREEIPEHSLRIGKLANTSLRHRFNTYRRIWDPVNFSRFNPNEEVDYYGHKIAKLIPPDEVRIME